MENGANINGDSSSGRESSIRAIAVYLPQFHPTPENDRWWGKGFTEWTNVAKAKPLFPGHYQPHLPADLGFYDLRLPEVRQAQADLAREHGIHGFCYYHYWFGGRRLLDRPFSEVLASGKPEFPFCLCWANERWTTAWDGSERQTLMEQTYSPEDDLAHIRSLFPAFEDPRYIRINGKPFFLVYRSEDMPNPERTTEIWRAEAIRAGIGEIFLARVDGVVAGLDDPRQSGFDAAVEFAPDWRNLADPLYRQKFHRGLMKVGALSDVYLKQEITKYEGLIARMLAKPFPNYPLFKCVTPGFDNSPRRAEGAAIVLDSTPQKYEAWLAATAKKTINKYVGDERIVFINAWNEWAEGNHLEPDQKYGLGFLEATKRSLREASLDVELESSLRICGSEISGIKKVYWRGIKYSQELKDLLKHAMFRPN